MELRAPETPVDGDPEEDTAAALQRLVELTATRVTPVRSLRVQYRLIRKLGSGSYGRVLLAQPRQGGPAVALKLLRRDSVLRATFLREFCVGRCVSSHPGLLQTLGGPLQTPRFFAFAQEYAPCGDLSRMLQEKGLPELMVKRVVAQLAGALDFLHGRGLVHADVKPDNVLVFDPLCSRVALGDLGLTRPEGSPTPAPPVPLPTAPPELCLLLPPDTLPLRPSVDSWALGVLLFCAATACFPWDVALAPDPEFEAFAGWMTTRPQPPRPPAPWDQFAPPALTLLQGLLDLDPDTRSPPLAVLDVLGDDWGLEGDAEGPRDLGRLSFEEVVEGEEGGSSLEECTDEEEEGGRVARSMGTHGELPDQVTEAGGPTWAKGPPLCPWPPGRQDSCIAPSPSEGQSPSQWGTRVQASPHPNGGPGSRPASSLRPRVQAQPPPSDPGSRPSLLPQTQDLHSSILSQAQESQLCPPTRTLPLS
ncbi:uncharacterized serine/threonine-protein kinase SBK3 isoform X2 [Marmota marmota marmota]|uniref:uncharacterized serine/threonine-protein kinase SBK3 isoform X2 n=1 Tax=Marmota marmota marmota TaxID=9994 RepID=UPI0020930C19|nr:uncharacterized serine/threonine-protein kinase SBK3 isoform X2 [Marmota marmota marmota]